MSRVYIKSSLVIFGGLVPGYHPASPKDSC